MVSAMLGCFSFSPGDRCFLASRHCKNSKYIQCQYFHAPPYIVFVTDFKIIPIIHISGTFHLLTNSSSLSSITVYLLWSSSSFAPYQTLHSDSSQCFHLSGEIFELKAELNSDKKDRKKEAVKKVIASMTVGKDVR